MDKSMEVNLTKNLDSLTDGAKVAIVFCADAFRFGGNWGLVKKTNPDARGFLETLKQEKPNVKVFHVSNGFIVLCNENFLAYNVNLAVPNAIDGKFVDRAIKRRSEEQKKYVKFVNNVLAGKNPHIKRKNGYFEVTIGVFSVNDTHAIRIDGVEYPSYKLTLIEALEYIRYLNKDGKQIYVRAVTEDGKEIFDLLERIAFNVKGINAIYRGLEIAESGNGAFLTLRIV